MGGNCSVAKARRDRFRCSNPECKYCKTAEIDFKSKGRLITEPLRVYAEKQLAPGLTLKQVAHLTGLHKDVVKDIDKTRLEKLYAAEGEDGKRTLIKPETQARYLGMDEFKLHDGYRFATLIMDMETGCILRLQEGKKKQVVHDFIEHAGLEWMSKVEAASAGMNSDFEEAFLDKCPHLKIVFDRFRIVKNVNDKVISEVRKDEQKRLIEEGDIEDAKSLKGCRYILMSNWDTLKERDAEAREGKLVSKGSELFKKEPVKMKQNQLSRYCRLIKENELFFCLDYVKESVVKAYRQQTAEEMRIKIKNIVSYCRAVGNVHFDWFARLLDNHIDGIVTHAEFHLTNGKVEGINQKIKTIRRMSYGLPDDEYFFLKLFDSTRQSWKSQNEEAQVKHKNPD